MSVFRVRISLIITTLYFSSQATAHEHEELEGGVAISGDPIDGVLWAHIAAMFAAFGIIFPIGKYKTVFLKLVYRSYLLVIQNRNDPWTQSFSLACSTPDNGISLGCTWIFLRSCSWWTHV
jgi:hypothetical protein